MPIHRLKRHVRNVIRESQSWVDLIRLTLEGNTVQRKSILKQAENPVLLLHGLGSTRKTLSILERRLRRDGHTVISIHLGGLFDTFNSKKIEALASFVRDKVERLYKRYHFSGKMIVIGHSKGGLIGRYYVQCLGGDKRVSHLMTLGTPHNGTPWALLAALTPLSWIMKSLKQMTPYSPLIKTMQKSPFPHTVRLTSIYSMQDMMTPFPSGIISLETPHPHLKNILVDQVGHAEFLIKKTVYSHIKRLLRERPEIHDDTVRRLRVA